jgi:alkylation response protein AidB-like acyl-CoA dehydrogenase
VDFSFTEEQEAARGLARQIFEQLTHERLKEVEAGEDRIDRKCWADLADANLLGLPLPESVGGSGLGYLEAALVLEEVGRAVAPVPYLPTVVMGALPIAKLGGEAQQQRWLPGVVAGETILTAALVDGDLGADPLRPATTATRDGDGYRLDGLKICVPAGTIAEAILVPALSSDGAIGLFMLEANASGVRVERQDTTSGIPEARIELDGARVTNDDTLHYGTTGAGWLQWLVERTTTGLCMIAAGVCDSAVRMTAEYTKTREQFERPIATFQAVGQRAADAYIDTQAVRYTAYHAAWRLDEELPATAEVAVAKFWTAEGGQRVVHAAQHLHGGIGVDRDYPLHRYFLLAKQLELTLGGTTASLLRLGDVLAAPVPA